MAERTFAGWVEPIAQRDREGRAALMLDPCVVVSRFGEADTMTHELNSDALVDHWSRLMIALTRLELAIQQRETCDGAIVAVAA